MAYGKIYISEFTSIGQQDYLLEIYKKDYVGTFKNITSSSVPVVQRWNTDDPKPGIKGCALDIELLNEGNVSLQDFYAVEDDTFLVKFYWGSKLLFIGYLVNDDSSEPLLDYTHSIKLSATDNLGLLKDISLDKANAIVGDGNRIISGIQSYSVPSTPPAGEYLYINSTTTGAIIGDTLIISGTPGSDGIYTIVNVVPLGAPGVAIYLDTDIPFPIPNSTGYTYTFITPADLGDRWTYAYLLRVCLYSTSLLLNTDVYSTIKNESTASNRFLEETLECFDDFQNGNKDFKNCYDVIEIIMKRFRATLFQSEGVWNIIRRDEHRYYNNLIPGFRYDENMSYVSDIDYDDIFTADPNISTLPLPVTYPASAPELSIIRPYNFVKEQFNYKQRVLLKNYNLQTLGKLISTLTVGTIRTNKYEFPESSKWKHIYGDGSYITVITEFPVGGGEIEKERYVYQPKPGATSPPIGVELNQIEVNAGDSFDLEMQIKCASSASNGHYFFGVYLQTTTGDFWQLVNAFGTSPNNDYFRWNSGFTMPITFRSLGGVAFFSGNAQEYFSFKLSEIGHQKRVPQFPVDGLLTIRIYGTNDTNSSEPNVAVIWKDLKLTMTALINDSTQIIGHTHTNKQQLNIKNKEEEEIFIDDSPRNFIQGAMFLPSFTNLVQNRTLLWNYPFSLTSGSRLGYLTTFEELFWRRIQRSKLDGTMYGLVQDGPVVNYSGIIDFYTLSIPNPVYAIHITGIPPGVIQIGTTITASGTSSNNGSFTVIDIWTGTTLFPAGSYIVQQAVVTEPGVNCSIAYTTKRHLSMLTLLRYSGLPGLNFVMGKCDIDFRNNSFNSTLWEMYKDTEVDSDLRQFYEFKYLYDNK